MIDPSLAVAPPARSGRQISDAIARSLKRRYAAERRFKAYGLIAIGALGDRLGHPAVHDHFHRPAGVLSRR